MCVHFGFVDCGLFGVFFVLLSNHDEKNSNEKKFEVSTSSRIDLQSSNKAVSKGKKEEEDKPSRTVIFDCHFRPFVDTFENRFSLFSDPIFHVSSVDMNRLKASVQRIKSALPSTAPLGSTMESQTGTATKREGEIVDEKSTVSEFTLIVSGQIESAQFHSIDNAYCKYSFTYGLDWHAIQGVEQGISQISRKSGGSNRTIVWNFPIDVAFQSSNAHGWPRIVISVYNLDLLGRDVVRGYACVVVPPFAGRYVRYVRMFVPMSTSRMQALLAWLSGNRPEFYHAKFISQGRDREATRVSSSGIIKVVLNVASIDLQKCGYSSAATNASK